MTETNKQLNQSPVLYVGSYTTVRSKGNDGIFVYRLDLSSGALIYDSAVDAGPNPSYLALSPDRRFLYAVNETMSLNGQPGGGVSALAIDQSNARLTYLNQQRSHGGLPCYVSVDRIGRYAMVANYATGSAAILPIQANGQLSPASDVRQHSGSSVNRQRQEGPHAHSIVLDPANRFAYVPDLGIDKVMIYEIDYTNGKLAYHSDVGVHPGAGPRHLTFHPNGRFAYLIQEVDSTLSVFSYEAESGKLTELQTVSTLPAGFKGSSTCADVHVSPSGKFVYGSNRGHDSIAIFAIDEQTGKMTFVGHQPAGGKTPRNFTIDPTGAYLLAANQDTDNIVSFRIDAQTGKLTETGRVTEVHMPVCLKFA
ncbi:MAG: lactonase family protein [Chloroflexi bacterium]|nr:lactonase family protein [Chloroflexota bacterium]MCL5273819.1 lactonase family protein [Chloroflexota bacterium]